MENEGLRGPQVIVDNHDIEKVSPSLQVMAQVVARMLVGENVPEQTETLLLGSGEKIDTLSKYESQPNFRDQVILGREFSRVETYTVGGLKILGGGKQKERKVTSALDIDKRADMVYEFLPNLETSSVEAQDAFGGYMDRLLNELELSNTDLFNDQGYLNSNGQRVVFESVQRYIGEAVDVTGENYIKSFMYLNEVLGELETKYPTDAPRELVSLLGEVSLATKLIETVHIANPRESLYEITAQAYDQRKVVSEITAPDIAALEEASKNYEKLQSKTYLPTRFGRNAKISDDPAAGGMSVETAYRLANMGFNEDIKKLARDAIQKVNKDKGTQFTIHDMEAFCRILLREKYEQEQRLIAEGMLDPEQASIVEIAGFEDQEIGKMFFSNEPIEQSFLENLTPEQRAAIQTTLNIIRLTGVVAAAFTPVGLIVNEIADNSDDLYDVYHQATSGHDMDDLVDSGDNFHVAVHPDSHSPGQEEPSPDPLLELQHIAEEKINRVDMVKMGHAVAAGDLHRVDSGVEPLVHREALKQDGLLQSTNDTFGNASEIQEDQVHSQADQDLPFEPTHSLEVQQGEHSDGVLDVKDTSEPFASPEVQDQNNSLENTEDSGVEVADHITAPEVDDSSDELQTPIAQPGDLLTEEQLQRPDDSGGVFFEINYGETVSHALLTLGEGIPGGIDNTDLFGEDGEGGMWSDLKANSVAFHTDSEGNTRAFIVVYDDPSTKESIFNVITPGTDVTRAGARLVVVDIPDWFSPTDKDEVIRHVLDPFKRHFENSPISDLSNNPEREFVEHIDRASKLISNSIAGEQLEQIIEGRPIGVMATTQVSPEGNEWDAIYESIFGLNLPENTTIADLFQSQDVDGEHLLIRDLGNGNTLVLHLVDRDSDGRIDHVSQIVTRNDNVDKAVGEFLMLSKQPSVDEGEITTASINNPKIINLDDKADNDLENVNKAADQLLFEKGVVLRSADITDKDGNVRTQYVIEINADETGIVTGATDRAPFAFEIDESEVPETQEELINLINEKIEKGEVIVFGQTTFSEIKGELMRMQLGNNGVSVTTADGNIILNVAVDNDGNIITGEIPDDARVLRLDIANIPGDERDEITKLYAIAEEKLKVNPPGTSPSDEYKNTQTKQVYMPTVIDDTSPESSPDATKADVMTETPTLVEPPIQSSTNGTPTLTPEETATPTTPVSTTTPEPEVTVNPDLTLEPTTTPESEIDEIFTQIDPDAVRLVRETAEKTPLPNLAVNGEDIVNLGFDRGANIFNMIDRIAASMTIGMSTEPHDWLPSEIHISVGNYYNKIIFQRSSVASTPFSYNPTDGFVPNVIAILGQFNEDVTKGEETLEGEISNLVLEEVSQLVTGAFTLSFLDPESDNYQLGENVRKALSEIGIENGIHDPSIPDLFRTGQLAPWLELIQHALLENDSFGPDEWDGLSDSGYVISVPNSNGEVVEYWRASDALWALNRLIIDILGSEAVEEIEIPSGSFTEYLYNTSKITGVYTDPEILDKVQEALSKKGLNIFKLIGIRETDLAGKLKLDVSSEVLRIIEETVQYPYDLSFDELDEIVQVNGSLSSSTYSDINEEIFKRLKPYIEDGVISTDAGKFVPVRMTIDPNTGLPGFVFDNDSPTHLAPINPGRGVTPEYVINHEISPQELFPKTNSDGTTYVHAIPVGGDGLSPDTRILAEMLEGGEITIEKIFELVYPPEQKDNLPERASEPYQMWGDVLAADSESSSQDTQFLRIRTINPDGTESYNHFVTVHVDAPDNNPFIVDGFVHGATPQNTSVLTVTIPEDEIPSDREELTQLLITRFQAEIEKLSENSSTPTPNPPMQQGDDQDTDDSTRENENTTIAIAGEVQPDSTSTIPSDARDELPNDVIDSLDKVFPHAWEKAVLDYKEQYRNDPYLRVLTWAEGGGLMLLAGMGAMMLNGYLFEKNLVNYNWQDDIRNIIRGRPIKKRPRNIIIRGFANYWRDFNRRLRNSRN